jgi:AcrR family transcriptional regulator
MVDLDAALGEQLFDVAVGEAKAQVPADRQHDHIRREAETGEGGLCNGMGADPASSHDASLAARVCSTADATAPERPAKRALSRQAIVAAALRLIRSPGNDGLTLRRLAAELDTGVASLYVYFKDTDELYAAVLDELLGGLDFRRGRKPWRERLISLLTSYSELLTAYPALAKTALFTRPSGANSVRLWETLLGLLDEGGIGGQDAAWTVDLLLQRATATAAEQGMRLQDANTAAADAQVVEVIDHLSPKDHPHLAGVAEELFTGTPTTRLIWSFEVLLDGIGARRQAATRPHETARAGATRDKGVRAVSVRRRS